MNDRLDLENIESAPAVLLFWAKIDVPFHRLWFIS